MNILSKITSNDKRLEMDADEEWQVIDADYEEVHDDVMKINVNDLVESIKKDPKALDDFIKKVSERLKKAKADAKEINDRGFWKRLVSSNVRDVSGILISQSDVMTSFFTLLQLITFLCKGNAGMLTGLMDTINKSEHLKSKENEELYEFAKLYFEEAVKFAETEKIREDALKKLLLHAERTHGEILLLQQNSVSNEEFTNLISCVKSLEESLKEDIAQLQSYNDELQKQVQKLSKKSFLDTMWYKASVGVAALVALGISIFSIL